MVGRALPLSLAGHAALILAFLLLSATRQPARIPEVVRPIRLVASIEPPAPAARPRPARPVEAAPARPAIAQAPGAEPARIRPHAPSPEPPVAVAVPKIVIPTPAPAASPAPRPLPQPGAPAPSFGERLSRLLAAASPAATDAGEAAAPQIAALAPQEPAPRAPAATPAPVAPEGAVVPVGLFPHAWYLKLLREKLYARWSPPSQFYLGGRAPAALVALRIDRAGRIDRVALKEGSGSARFDQSALAAVKGLGQAPALPEQYPEETLDVVIRFQNE